MAQFNKDFEYKNIGSIVGTLCFTKELTKKDGTVYGHEFLINVKNFGSVNVRIPMLSKSQAMVDKFPAAEKHHVRVNLAQVDQYHSKTSNKTYTNFTTFSEFKEVGPEVEDGVKGNISGEVVKIQNDNGKTKFLMAIYSVKDGEQLKRYDGQPFPPKAIVVEVVDKELNKQFDEEVKEGTNLTVGYYYYNKSTVEYDEFGLPLNDGGKVSRVEAKRLIALANKKEPKPQVKEDNFDFEDDGFDPFEDNVFEFNDEDIPF